MPFPTTSTTKRVIPTERLDALCEEFRTAVDKFSLMFARITIDIKTLPITDLEKLRLLTELDAARPRYELLTQIESYLKYNKARIVRNRRRAAEQAKHDIQHTPYIPPHLSSYLQDAEDHDTSLTFDRAAYNEWNRTGQLPTAPSQPPEGYPTAPPGMTWAIDAFGDWSLKRVASPPTVQPKAAPLPELPTTTTLTDKSGNIHEFGPAQLPEVIPPNQFSIKRRGG